MAMFYWMQDSLHLIRYDTVSHEFRTPGTSALRVSGMHNEALADALFGSEDRCYTTGIENNAIAKAKSYLLKLLTQSEHYSWVAASISNHGGVIRQGLDTLAPATYARMCREAKDETVDRHELEHWCQLAAMQGREHGLECADWYRERYAKDIAEGRMVIRHLIYRPEWMLKPGSPLPLLETLSIQHSDEVYQLPEGLEYFVPQPTHIGYAQWRHDINPNIHNGNSYAPLRLKGDINQGNALLETISGNYYDYLNTCDYLNYELTAWHYRNDGIGMISPEGTPRRFHLGHPFDFTNRYAAIGVDTATLLYHVTDGPTPDCETYLLAHHRSNQVTAAGGNYNTIPAGCYERYDDDSNCRPEDTIRREFVEEIWGMETMKRAHKVKLIRKYLTEAVPLYYLGLGLEPSDLHCELLTLMQLDLQTKAGLQYVCNHNSYDELQSFFDSRSNYEGEIFMVPFVRDELENLLGNDSTNRDGVSNGFACFREILEILLEHYEELKEAP